MNDDVLNHEFYPTAEVVNSAEPASGENVAVKSAAGGAR